VADKRPKGRPSTYTPEIAAEILRRMTEGETLLTMCREPGMPPASTVKMWAVDNLPEGFADRYARAREFQADAIAEQALDIADSSEPSDAAKVRIQVDTRKWLASKINPAKFGDLTKIADPNGNPIRFTFALDNANAEHREGA